MSISQRLINGGKWVDAVLAYQKIAIEMTRNSDIFEVLTMDLKDYRPSARLTVAIVELSKRRSIDLQPAFDNNQRSWKELSAYIKLSLGICGECLYMNSRAESARKVVYVGEAKNWSRTQQANFSHLFKKCARAAAGVLDINAFAEEDKDSGTLVLTGGDVGEIFGRDRVLLKEQRYDGASKRASYAALSEIAQEKRRITLSAATKTDSGRVNLSEEPNIKKLFKDFVDALTLVKPTLSAEEDSALRAFQQMIDGLVSDSDLSPPN